MFLVPSLGQNPLRSPGIPSKKRVKKISLKLTGIALGHFLWFIWLCICSLKMIHCVVPCMPPAATHVDSPSAHTHTHGSAHGRAAPLYSALPGFRISQADTQQYNAILVSESLDLKGRIPCKAHAAEMQHLRRLCPVGTLCFHRSHLQ